MKITQWLKSLIHTEQREMPDMKDIVTDDMVKGTPYVQSVLGKQRSDVYILAIRERIQDTPGVLSILSFDTNYDGTSRRVTFTSSIDTIYGQTTVTSEA
ncbi:hypothetical protein DML18_12460 [Salmonella enterica]|nr:hypothetical protein [Salmonella enterica]ECY2383947.1 hypothetical protein [Salmonella enterica]ECY2607853.1 hypothetical protein [Salmonella enterica]ECY2770925.1 hypothetical protein [Salmonella enterica]ECZ5972164.1 hypothetical protein [Salmonella enterica]